MPGSIVSGALGAVFLSMVCSFSAAFCVPAALSSCTLGQLTWTGTMDFQIRGQPVKMETGDNESSMYRRDLLSRLGTAAGVCATLGAGAVLAPKGAKANGMLDFPPIRLNNRYFLMRAGQGGSDKRGLIQSHPVDKLHVDNGLTDQGISEAIKAASVLRNLGVDNAFIWADISSRAQETARILAQELGIRQERVVPEYAFLEPRGMGIYDGKDAAAVLPEVYKMDAQDLLWSPPPNTDGTPNESVNQVFSRVRQLMSKLETLYQGEDVVIVSPDSDCLSILQAFVLGESLGTHSRHYLGPGEGHPLLVSPNTEYLYDTRRAGSGNLELGGDMAGIEVAAAPSGVRGGTT